MNLRTILAKTMALFRREAIERELAKEQAAHLAFLADTFIDNGMSVSDAQLAARRAYGHLDQAKQMHREERSFMPLENALQTLRFSGRSLYKNKWLSVAILLTLAIGIGANTTMFTVVYAVLLAPLPAPNPEQLLIVASKVSGHSDYISAADFLDWKQNVHGFSELNAWSGGGFNLSYEEQPENILAMHVTTDFFHMLGDHFFLGRDFLSTEGEIGKDHEVILTHKMWLRLGANTKIIGTSLRMDGEPYVVVGVLAPGYRDRDGPQLIVPLAFRSEQLNHDYHWLNIMGRVYQADFLPQVQTSLDTANKRIAQQFPKSNVGRVVTLEPLRSASLPRDRRLMLYLLLGTVLLILLIACVNIANLLLARGVSRRREISVRLALGATSRHIFALFLTESLLLAACGGMLGVGTAVGMIKAVVALLPPRLFPAQADIHISFPVLLFTLVVSVISGILFGSAPAWFATRIKACENLKEGGAAGVGREQKFLRHTLVVGELALSVALLSGAGMLIHTFWNLTRVDLGVRTDHVLTFVLGAPQSRSKDPERIVQYYHQILATIKLLPGVREAAVMSGMPLSVPGFSMAFNLSNQRANPDRHLSASVQQVSPDYFRTFGVEIEQGRAFTEQDTLQSVRVAMVSQSFADRYLKDVDPLQQRIRMQEFIPGVSNLGPAVDWQIVGVFHTVRSFGLRHDDGEEIDIPFWQSPWDSTSVGIRTEQNPETMLRTVGTAIHSVDPAIALAEPQTMSEVRDGALANDRVTMILFATFAGLTLLLATLGIYSVMHYFVSLRSHEFGIRSALGEPRHTTVNMVLAEAGRLSLMGLGIGTLLALAVGRVVQTLLYGVSVVDPMTLCSIWAVMSFTAFCAAFIPALRAVAVSPTEALRAE